MLGETVTEEPKKQEKKIWELQKSADAGEWKQVLNIVPKEEPKKETKKEEK